MIQHQIFSSSLRQNTSNAAVNHNGDWGGTGGKFGVFGQSRSNRSVQSQAQSKSYEYENRVRTGYRKARTQIGRSNLRKTNKDNQYNRNIYALVSPPRTAPLRRRKSSNLTSPIKARRIKTSHGDRKKSKPGVRRMKKNFGNPQVRRREFCRLQPPESPRASEKLELNDAMFSSPSKDDLRFFESLPLSPMREEIVVTNMKDEVRGIIRSESAPCLRSKNRFLTTNASVYELKSPSRRIEIISPAKKERIRRNQDRINKYVEQKRAHTLLQDTKNIESKKSLMKAYQDRVDALEEYNFKLEKRKENMWGLT